MEKENGGSGGIKPMPGENSLFCPYSAEYQALICIFFINNLLSKTRFITKIYTVLASSLGYSFYFITADVINT